MTQVGKFPPRVPRGQIWRLPWGQLEVTPSLCHDALNLSFSASTPEPWVYGFKKSGCGGRRPPAVHRLLTLLTSRPDCYRLASPSDPLWVLLSLDTPGRPQFFPPFCNLPGSPHPTATPTPLWPGENGSGYDRVGFPSFCSQVAEFYSQGIPVCPGVGGKEAVGRAVEGGFRPGEATGLDGSRHHSWGKGISKYLNKGQGLGSP